MKVALVAKDIYPSRGGVELHVHNLALELDRLGHQVHVFTSARPAVSLRPNGHAISTEVGPLDLCKSLRRGGFDVVHAHGARTPFTAEALLVGRSLGVRTVFTPHCFYPPQDWRGSLKRKIFDPTLGRSSLRRADHIICLTENDRADAIAQGAPPQRIRIVPNSIRLPEVPSPDDLSEFHARYPWGRFLLCVGRLDRVKRGDFLISALPRLPLELGLVFIGPDAGCRKTWQTLAVNLGAQSRVHFVPEIGDKELLLAYCASTALVMASAYEGLPTVLLEAMWLRTPVIAAATGGIRYLIEDGINGLLFRYDDLADFCARVEQCLAGIPPALPAEAAERVRTRYSWEINGARIAALYQERLREDDEN